MLAGVTRDFVAWLRVLEVLVASGASRHLEGDRTLCALTEAERALTESGLTSGVRMSPRGHRTARVSRSAIAAYVTPAGAHPKLAPRAIDNQMRCLTLGARRCHAAPVKGTSHIHPDAYRYSSRSPARHRRLATRVPLFIETHPRLACPFAPVPPSFGVSRRVRFLGARPTRPSPPCGKAQTRRHETRSMDRLLLVTTTRAPMTRWVSSTVAHVRFEFTRTPPTRTRGVSRHASTLRWARVDRDRNRDSLVA